MQFTVKFAMKFSMSGLNQSTSYYWKCCSTVSSNVLVVVTYVNGTSLVACLYNETGRTLHCAPVSTRKRRCLPDSNSGFTNCMSSNVVAATFVEKTSSSSFRALICFGIFLHLVVQHLAAKWFGFKHLLQMSP